VSQLFPNDPIPSGLQCVSAKARRTDPDTSHEAARRADKFAATGQRVRCLECVEGHHGLTSGEMADLLGVDRHVPARRLPELRDAGLVKSLAPRKCRSRGSTSLTWWPFRCKVCQREIVETSTGRVGCGCNQTAA